ncbi:putative bacteriocin precursor [Anaerobacterium chartisolvens]|uniref:Putative bacteriocin n=1 Tax=Anaerobacterium chartisolvens TaxID=1297424 RepID=A0A369B227_9FIRM|nr:CLI_3235 family bacteriocin precursor [Anaerobacterium chartisolvens]RCX15471.1 putative bacteriocin precursor [Anaerobacterium chartisolvens]
MKKLGKNIKPTKETVEAYSCSCSATCSGCPCACGGNGTASYYAGNGTSKAMGTDLARVINAYNS